MNWEKSWGNFGKLLYFSPIPVIFPSVKAIKAIYYMLKNTILFFSWNNFSYDISLLMVQQFTIFHNVREILHVLILGKIVGKWQEKISVGLVLSYKYENIGWKIVPCILVPKLSICFYIENIRSKTKYMILYFWLWVILIYSIVIFTKFSKKNVRFVVWVVVFWWDI